MKNYFSDRVYTFFLYLYFQPLKFYFDILVISNIKVKFSISKIYNFYSLVFITEPTIATNL